MAKIDTTCPDCGAPHARKLSILHAEGLSSTEGSMQSVGTYQTIGRQKIKTEGTVKSVQQTEQSKAAARPDLPTVRTKAGQIGAGLLIGGFVLGIIVGTIENAFGMPGETSFGSAVAIAVVVALVSMPFLIAEPTAEEVAEHKRMFKDQYKAHDEWERTFACLACGYRFVSEPA